MSSYSAACCSIPPVVAKNYAERGTYADVGGLKTYITGPPSSQRAIVVVYDIFGFFPQTLQGADILAFGDQSHHYRVFVPDFFEGKAADPSWYPPTTPEHETALGNFFGGVGSPARAVGRIPDIVRAIKEKHTSINDVFALGMCWGGKVVTLCSSTGSPFKAVAQAHPAMVDPSDAKNVTVPMCVLASKDEDAKDIAAFKDNLQVDNRVETFETQIHGWMAARANLEDPEVSEKYSAGYRAVLEFFGSQMHSSFSAANSTIHIILWSLRSSATAAKLARFVQQIPSLSYKEGRRYVLASRSGATKVAPKDRQSKSQGNNLATFIVFESEEDLMYFGTEDPVHHQMVAMVEEDLFKPPIVVSFTDCDYTFHPPNLVGGTDWGGVWS